MRVYGYGEDALTLWALTNRLKEILDQLGDGTEPGDCEVFYRPSFGRRGGERSAQFGEFDFILLADERLYLGECKRTVTSREIKSGAVELPSEQILRHDIFKFYVNQWTVGNYSDWREFSDAAKEVRLEDASRPLAPEGSTLARNLETVLGRIKARYPSGLDVRNLLLYLHLGRAESELPLRPPQGFDHLVCLSYEGATEGKYIAIEM